MTTKKTAKTPATVDEALAQQLEDLRAQLDKALAEKEELKRQLAAKPSGRSGWLVRTPFKGYSGTTAGVIFRSGLAFLPDTEEGTAKAQYLANEFGYKTEYVTDWQEVDRPTAEQVGKSLVDALIMPDRR